MGSSKSIETQAHRHTIGPQAYMFKDRLVQWVG
jgi:hypothetical protein